MAAITPLQIKIVDDMPSATVREMRKQWNKLVTDIAALDASTATAEDLIEALQGLKKVVFSRELPDPPYAPTV